MKFSFSKQGLVYEHYGDTITKFWPWKRKTAKYHSKLLALDFNSFREYWSKVGEEQAVLRQSPEKKCQGFSMYTVLSSWSKYAFPGQAVVVLHDINPEAKDDKFWKRLPADRAVKFQNDVVVLICKDKDEAVQVAYGVDPAFADAYAVSEGIMFACNYWID